MRRMVVIAGAAAAAARDLAFGRRRGSGPEAAASSEDLQYTLFAPGGPQGFWFNGPVGWAFSKVQPFSHAGVYTVVAEMLELRPEDELLDVGCGPGAFRRIIEDAGFTELSVRYKGVWFLADNRIVACRKPASALRDVASGRADVPVGANPREAAEVEAITVA